jgi:hypothetical protein
MLSRTLHALRADAHAGATAGPSCPQCSAVRSFCAARQAFVLEAAETIDISITYARRL